MALVNSSPSFGKATPTSRQIAIRINNVSSSHSGNLEP
jgi:hypothetical protein